MEMEKLSGILPSNRRVKTVDTNGATAARPGAPSHGRSIGSVASMRDRVSISGLTPEEVGKDTLTYKNPKEAMRAKIAEKVSNNFFATKAEDFGAAGAAANQRTQAMNSDDVLQDIDQNNPRPLRNSETQRGSEPDDVVIAIPVMVQEVRSESADSRGAIANPLE